MVMDNALSSFTTVEALGEPDGLAEYGKRMMGFSTFGVFRAKVVATPHTRHTVGLASLSTSVRP